MLLPNSYPLWQASSGVSNSCSTFIRMYFPQLMYVSILRLFAAMLCIMPATLAAQESVNGKVQGLPSNNVYFISQDSSGFLWMGSDKGLNRFDGHVMKNFTMGDELTDNDIFSMFHDRQGRYWFLTNGGVPTVLDHGLFLNTRNTPWLSGIRPGRPGLHITQTPDGTIWYTTYDTIYRIAADLSIQRFSNPYAGKKNFGFQAVVTYRDSIYFITNRTVINHSSGKSYSFGADSLFVLNYYTKIFPALDGFFYFSVDKLFFFSFRKHSSTLAARIQPGEIILGYLGSDDNGNVRFSSDKNVYQFHFPDSKLDLVPGPFPSHVTSILTDNKRNTWIASMKEGVSYRLTCSGEREAISFLPGSGKCNGINRLSSGIYFCFDEGQWGDLSNGRVITHSLRSNPYHLPVRRIREDVKGGQFIITYGDLYYKRGNVEKALTQAVKDVAVTANGTYLATSSGLLKFPASTDVLSNPVFQYLPSERIDDSRYYHLEKGNGDSLFAGTPEGLKLFAGDKPVPLPWNDPIVNSHITSIQKLRNGDIAFSSASEGIGLIHQNSLQVFTRANGLLSNACNTIIEGSQSDFWVGSTEGINRMTISDSKYKIMSIPGFYQMRGKNINDLELSGDSLFVATDNGCFIYRLSHSQPCDVVPDVAFNSFVVNDQPQRISPSYDLAFDQNNIVISYAGIAFNAKGALYFRYKLREEDSTWITTTATEVRYPFLPDGQYKFQVEASPDQENWSVPRSIRFVIQKPFWKTWWFILSALLLALAILIFIFRYVAVAQKRRMQFAQLQLRSTLEQVSSQKKMAQLQQKALAMQLNPHFIFNALNSIKGLYAGGQNQEAKLFIASFASLMRTMLQAGRQNFHSLADEIAFTRQYLEFYAKRSSSPFTYEINLSPDIDAYSIYIPVLLLQPIIENAVLHGIEPSSKEGIIQIAILRSGDELQIDITDNGVGLNYKSKYVEEEKESWGLLLVKERIALIGEGNSSAGVYTREIVTEQGLVQGTAVQLVIPIINREQYDTLHYSR